MESFEFSVSQAAFAAETVYLSPPDFLEKYMPGCQQQAVHRGAGSQLFRQAHVVGRGSRRTRGGENMRVSISHDGESWQQVASVSDEPSRGERSAAAYMTAHFDAKTCRFVKLDFQRRGRLVIDEIEVLAGKNPVVFLQGGEIAVDVVALQHDRLGVCAAAAESAHRAYVGIGSNLAGPARQLRLALERLEGLDPVIVDGVSGLYRSEPLGGIEQPAFLNAVIALLTELDPAALLAELQSIETALGRDRNVMRWGPRRIDLDLLLFDDVTISAPDLAVPHPGIGGRNFVLLPLREIAPDFEIPGLGRVLDIAVDEKEPRISRIA